MDKPSSNLDNLAKQLFQWQLRFPAFAYVLIETADTAPRPPVEDWPRDVRPAEEPGGWRTSHEGHALWHHLCRLSRQPYNTSEARDRLRGLAGMAVRELAIPGTDPLKSMLAWLLDCLKPERKPLAPPALKDWSPLFVDDGKREEIKPPAQTYLVIPDVYLALADAMLQQTTALEAAKAEVPSQAVSDSPAGAENDMAMLTVILDLGSETGTQIYAVAHNESMSVDQRQRAIHLLDDRADGWTGERWGRLLGVTPQAARKTDWWRENHPLPGQEE